MQYPGLAAAVAAVLLACPPAFAADPPKPDPAKPVSAATPAPAVAKPGAGMVQVNSGQHSSIRMTIGEARLIKLSEPASAIVLGNPDLASIQVRSGTTFLLLALKAGRTTLFALGEDERMLHSAEVVVVQDSRAMSEALRQAVPDGKFQISATEGGVVLTGTVQSADDALTAGRIVAQFAGDPAKVINRVRMTGPNQVQLRVRIAEVKRTALRAIGLNWESLLRTSPNSTIGIVTGASSRLGAALPTTGKEVFGALAANVTGRTLNFSSVLDLLEQQGLATVLAQPSLSAVSGQSATFLAGGEIPIPVPISSSTTSQVALQYKTYGVSLSFTPTILSGRRISMRVNPEVSSLDPATAVTYNGYNVPGIATRRADTSIELGSGESFIIAGLLSDSNSRTINKVPGAGDIPVLGALFRSENYQRDETELLIVVTPFLATASDNAIPLPTDNYPGGTLAAPTRPVTGPGLGTK